MTISTVGSPAVRYSIPLIPRYIDAEEAYRLLPLYFARCEALSSADFIRVWF